jgi:serine phosphatase RsbU (regulator of sigma subunit)
MRTIPIHNRSSATNHLWTCNNNVDRKSGLFRNFKEKLRDKTIELEEKHLDMIRSIEYASRIQDAMLPSGKLFESFFTDYFILNKPKEIVNGDFYWMNKVDNKLIFTIADCTGHGVPGAFMSILGIMLLDQITGVDKVIQADRILNILRERVTQAISHNINQGEMKEGLDLTLCVYDPEKQTLQFSGALDRIYQIRDNSLNKVELDQFHGHSHLDYDVPCEKHEVDVKSGDVFYLFTDGYPDQFGGEKNKKFTVKRFQDLLMKIYHKKMGNQKKILEDTIMKWQGSIEQLDDITVMGIRF